MHVLASPLGMIIVSMDASLREARRLLDALTRDVEALRVTLDRLENAARSNAAPTPSVQPRSPPVANRAATLAMVFGPGTEKNPNVQNKMESFLMKLTENEPRGSGIVKMAMSEAAKGPTDTLAAAALVVVAVYTPQGRLQNSDLAPFCNKLKDAGANVVVLSFRFGLNAEPIDRPPGLENIPFVTVWYQYEKEMSSLPQNDMAWQQLQHYYNNSRRK
jgi:alkanesulfonate monooxygenase SsuD/methylene tetrahydromethanopterin reductase-like flavin-dependent oxidoreductase (luciferase family)